MPAGKQAGNDDPLYAVAFGLLEILMRREDAEGRKKIYDDLYTLHVGAQRLGQPRSAKALYAMTSLAGVLRAQLDPH